MRDELLILYGEYLELMATCHDYLLQAKYKEKMDAIMIILEPMPYKATNPLDTY